MWTQKVSLSVFMVALCVAGIQGNPRSLDQEFQATFDASRVKRGAETFSDGKLQLYAEHEEIDLCENATVDAMFNFQDGITYAFRGPYFWKIIKDKIVEGYPKFIHEHWIGLPDYIDAAFTYKNDQIIFLKGPHYWKFTNEKCDVGYPKLIKEGFPGIPDDIQAATAWGKKGFIYFFKGPYYWRYEPACEHPVKRVYPKLIRDVFSGIEDDIDEAIWHTNGELYMLKGIWYWRFNIKTFKVEIGTSDPYPILSAPQWFGCHPEP